MATTCTHLDQIQDVTARTPDGCEECLKTGDTWVHLRECIICGHIGCGDSSKNKHATAHFHETGHPIIQSFESGEDWRWRYVDNMTFWTDGDLTGAFVSRRAFSDLVLA